MLILHLWYLTVNSYSKSSNSVFEEAVCNFMMLPIKSCQLFAYKLIVSFWISSAQQGPILCGRPILKSTIPSLCNIHFPKAQKDVKHALKKAGLNVSSSSKLAPKFHVVIAEYVHQIQAKRRAAQKHKCKTVVVKEELPTWPAFSIGNTLLGYSCAAE